MHFGFSYVGLILLVMLMVPIIIWTRFQPKDYDKYVGIENRVWWHSCSWYTVPMFGHMFSGDGIMTEFGMCMNLGGTVEGNEAAMIECSKEIEEFLGSHHGK